MRGNRDNTNEQRKESTRGENGNRGRDGSQEGYISAWVEER